MDLVTLSFTRRSLSAVVADLDRSVMRHVPAFPKALRLPIRYVDILQKEAAPMTPEQLTLGATRDAAEAARVGELRAARLQALKADIIASVENPELMRDAIALRHDLSPRCIRMLLDDEQTNFSDFVREQRLKRAYRMLSSSKSSEHDVTSIVLQCGFGDLSHFNRSFRRRFGATPSDIRSRAQQEPAT